jgi:hypothetical protein
MIAITIFIGGFTLCFAVPALHGIAGHSRAGECQRLFKLRASSPDGAKGLEMNGNATRGRQAVRRRSMPIA